MSCFPNDCATISFVPTPSAPETSTVSELPLNPACCKSNKAPNPPNSALHPNLRVDL